MVAVLNVLVDAVVHVMQEIVVCVYLVLVDFNWLIIDVRDVWAIVSVVVINSAYYVQVGIDCIKMVVILFVGNNVCILVQVVIVQYAYHASMDIHSFLEFVKWQVFVTQLTIAHFAYLEHIYTIIHVYHAVTTVHHAQTQIIVSHACQGLTYLNQIWLIHHALLALLHV